MVKTLLYLIKTLLIALLNLLPGSFLGQYYEHMDTTFFEYLNWFLPLDICLDIIVVWASNLPLVFLFIFIFDFVKDTVVEAVRKVIMFFIPQ